MNAPDRYVAFPSLHGKTRLQEHASKVHALPTVCTARIPKKADHAAGSNKTHYRKQGIQQLTLKMGPNFYSNVGHHIETSVDKPERHELFLLGDGEKKVEEEVETRTYGTIPLYSAVLMTCT